MGGILEMAGLTSGPDVLSRSVPIPAAETKCEEVEARVKTEAWRGVVQELREG